MNKKKLALCLMILPVFLLTSCKRHYDTTYSPWEEDANIYVWVAEKENLFFEINPYLGTIGSIIIDEEQKPILIEGDGVYVVDITEYERGKYIYTEGELFIQGAVGQKLIETSHPKYEEGKFSIRVPLKFGQLYAGKKITFTRYEKDTVQPSDFGFDYESWDDLVSQFELVDADTGETVSLDVLK